MKRLCSLCSLPPALPAAATAAGSRAGRLLSRGRDRAFLGPDDRRTRCLHAGRARRSQPTPAVIVGFAGEIYQTPRMNVNIVHAPVQ